MTEQWRQSIARISSAHGTGTAFVIGEGTVLTCLHNLEGVREGELDVFFPLSKMSIRDWRVAGHDVQRDIAILKTTTPLPAQARPLRWSEHRLHSQFSTYGFSESGVDGLRAEGSIYDTSPGHAGVSVLQLDKCNGIARGFSGAPVIDLERTTVVGMVTTVTAPDKDARGAFSSFAVPTSEVSAVVPGLLREAPTPTWGWRNGVNLGLQR